VRIRIRTFTSHVSQTRFSNRDCIPSDFLE
jgi:hypothetical protein